MPASTATKRFGPRRRDASTRHSEDANIAFKCKTVSTRASDLTFVDSRGLIAIQGFVTITSAYY
jgi:hypothetical protein